MASTWNVALPRLKHSVLLCRSLTGDSLSTVGSELDKLCSLLFSRTFAFLISAVVRTLLLEACSKFDSFDLRLGATTFSRLLPLGFTVPFLFRAGLIILSLLIRPETAPTGSRVQTQCKLFFGESRHTCSQSFEYSILFIRPIY